MKNKPDYRGYCLYIQEWDKHNITYSLSDMLELAFKHHCPIPKEYIINGRIRRDNLINKLVNYWRIAENWYLETGKDTLKEKVKKIQNRLHLNEHELKLLEGQCNSLGI
jgi:hypothetical protein